MTRENETRGIEYPAEMSFKSIFRNRFHTLESIKSILSESDIGANIESRESRNGKFISFTITARFSSEDELQNLCSKISSLEGFMTLF